MVMVRADTNGVPGIASVCKGESLALSGRTREGAAWTASKGSGTAHFRDLRGVLKRPGENVQDLCAPHSLRRVHFYDSGKNFGARIATHLGSDVGAFEVASRPI